jgi:uncharacterized membrane protein
MSVKKLPGLPHHLQPFRRAVLRGLGVVLPPLLTIVILIWIVNTFQAYVLNPVETASRHAIVWFLHKPLTNVPYADTVLERVDKSLESGDAAPSTVEERVYRTENQTFVRIGNGDWIPRKVRNAVVADLQTTGDTIPTTGDAYYHRYVGSWLLKKAVVVPVFLAGFILFLYLLGKFLAAGVGRILWNAMEQVINQLPIIRSVYSSVKQVTDFFFGESDIEFTRVVAVEYPRRGAWSLGFVTGDSLQTIRDAAGEPVLSVLMPTSPVPGTGFTITVRKSETIDVDIPIDQALQFVVSCGVVIPDHELQRQINTQIAAGAAKLQADGGLVTN